MRRNGVVRGIAWGPNRACRMGGKTVFWSESGKVGECERKVSRCDKILSVQVRERRLL